MKKDNGNKKLAKFTIFIIFGLILLINLYVFYGLLHLIICEKSINEGPGIYISLACIVSILLGYYLYKENFNDFSRSHNYNRKYFIYFFLLIFFTAIFYIKVANINRERLFIEKGYGKELIENGGVKPFDPKKKPTSLEGKLRLWYYINFEKKDTINK